MTRAQEFEQLRPLLFSIAYRILGSASEAEDAVQETWLRFDTSPTQPTSIKAFLSAVVTRISIDVLRSARVRREEYVGPWFPEPLLTDPYEDPEHAAELADSLSMAALLLLERLSPLERAVFVLREVFGFGFPEVASAVGRSEAACRQLALRARRHMDTGRPRFQVDRREREELAERFFDAFTRQARAPGAGGGPVGGRPRGEPGSPRLTPRPTSRRSCVRVRRSTSPFRGGASTPAERCSTWTDGPPHVPYSSPMTVLAIWAAGSRPSGDGASDVQTTTVILRSGS
jgi:RNA polymerase sigma factor (sigma-70 family)